eukprot:1425834-Prymnesium_polylepis.2
MERSLAASRTSGIGSTAGSARARSAFSTSKPTLPVAAVTTTRILGATAAHSVAARSMYIFFAREQRGRQTAADLGRFSDFSCHVDAVHAPACIPVHRCVQSV